MAPICVYDEWGNEFVMRYVLFIEYRLKNLKPVKAKEKNDTYISAKTKFKFSVPELKLNIDYLI